MPKPVAHEWTASEPLGAAMAKGPPLATLLERVARGDARAFASLYDATSAKLFGVILRILRRRDVADDILQDVYVRIWERAVDFDVNRGSPIAWMGAIARHRALDELRRRSSRPAIDDDAVIEHVTSDEASPLAALEQSQELARLQRCLEALGPERRAIVLLAYRDGLSREDLGRRLGKPVGTIKTWLHRSVAQLKVCLGQ